MASTNEGVATNEEVAAPLLAKVPGVGPKRALQIAPNPIMQRMTDEKMLAQ